MFHKFVGAGNLGEWNSLGDRETRPTGPERRIQVPRRGRLRLLWEVVTTQKEQANILEYHQPERDCGGCYIRRVGRDRSPHFQQIDVSPEVRSECYFDDMVDP